MSLLRNVKTKSKKVIKAMLPSSLKEKMGLSVDPIDFGDLRRLQAIDPDFGFSRGKVIDRYYIEKFLQEHAGDVRGRVLELGDSSYTKRYGGSRVTKSDVLHYTKGNPQATIIADLTTATNIESNTFDCIIFTQTLQMIYDHHAALKTLQRILRPNGVLLCTANGISKICRVLGTDPWGEYWRYTAQSSKIMFEEAFKAGNVKVTTYGNVLTAIAFLHGVAAEELSESELNYHDSKYEVLIGVRAEKTAP